MLKATRCNRMIETRRTPKRITDLRLSKACEVLWILVTGERNPCRSFCVQCVIQNGERSSRLTPFLSLPLKIGQAISKKESCI
jgi:hypothetical protein